MPSWLADVNENLKAPVKATLLVGAMGIIGVLLYAFNTVVALVDVTVIFEIGYAIFALSVALMPYVRKQVYERSVPVKRKILGIPLVSLIGVPVFAFLMFILAITWGNPILLPINIETLASLGIIYAVGGVIYAIATQLNKKKGIEVSLLFQEIPPE
jgi:hypothetical protein